MKNEIKFVPQAPKTYEVRYVENENQEQIKQSPLSPAARSKVIQKWGGNYVSERAGEVNPGYGPCKNSLCGCNCSSDTCTCANASWKTKDAGAGFSTSGRAWHEMNDVGASGKVRAHMCNVKAGDIEGDIMSFSAGGEVGATPAGISLKGKLGVDAINLKSDGVQANIGLNVDTGVSVNTAGKVEVKVIGFGFEAGDNSFGISTPFGGFSFSR